MGIPGSLLAVLVADRLGCKRLNSYGFILLSVSFALLALAWHLAPDAHAWHFVLFCLVTLLLNWGPNLGTYVLPALCFPAAIQFHGYPWRLVDPMCHLRAGRRGLNGHAEARLGFLGKMVCIPILMALEHPWMKWAAELERTLEQEKEEAKKALKAEESMPLSPKAAAKAARSPEARSPEAGGGGCGAISRQGGLCANTTEAEIFRSGAQQCLHASKSDLVNVHLADLALSLSSREETLPKLGTEYVDLLLIHTPCLERSDFPNKCGSKLRAERLDTYRGLMELRAAGKIRAIGETRSQLRWNMVGVSNYLAEQVEEVVAELKEAPAVNQVEWHLAYHNETLRQRMESSSVRLEAWASLAGPTGQGSPSISLADERLKKVAGRYNMSTAQLELRWETLRGVVPVTATCSREHAVGDMNSFNFNLSNEERTSLNSTKRTALTLKCLQGGRRGSWRSRGSGIRPRTDITRRRVRLHLDALGRQDDLTAEKSMEKSEIHVKALCKHKSPKPWRYSISTQMPSKLEFERGEARWQIEDVSDHFHLHGDTLADLPEEGIGGSSDTSSVQMPVFTDLGPSLAREVDFLGTSVVHRSKHGIVPRFPGDNTRIALRAPGAEKAELLTPRTAGRASQVAPLPGAGMVSKAKVVQSAKLVHQRYLQGSPVRTRQAGPLLLKAAQPAVGPHGAVWACPDNKQVHSRMAAFYGHHVRPHVIVARGPEGLKPQSYVVRR
eukprot:g23276.t1